MKFGLIGTILGAVIPLFWVDYCNFFYNWHNIPLMFFSLWGVVFSYLVVNEQIKENIVQKFKNDYEGNEMWYGTDLPNWFLALSEKHPKWEKKFKNQFDVKKAKELLQEYHHKISIANELN